MERMGFCFEKNPEFAGSLLDSDAAPVDRHIQHVAGIDVPVDKLDSLAIVIAEPRQQLTVGLEPDLFHPEHGHRVGPDLRIYDRQHLVEAGKRDGCLGEHEEMELLQVPLTGDNQVED